MGVPFVLRRLDGDASDILATRGPNLKPLGRDDRCSGQVILASFKVGLVKGSFSKGQDFSGWRSGLSGGGK